MTSHIQGPCRWAVVMFFIASFFLCALWPQTLFCIVCVCGFRLVVHLCGHSLCARLGVILRKIERKRVSKLHFSKVPYQFSLSELNKHALTSVCLQPTIQWILSIFRSAKKGKKEERGKYREGIATALHTRGKVKANG